MGRLMVLSLRWANIFGAGLSFHFGSSIVPWLMALFAWGVRHIPWSGNPPGPFPSPVLFIFHPNMNVGLIWLNYYIIAYTWSMLRLWHGKTKLKLSPFALFRTAYQTTSQVSRLSQGWPGEQKWELVERCYQKYREALKRYSPQPVQLKTPAGFYYGKGNELVWDGKILILPEELLTPERIHLLLPILAHHLAYYHSPDRKLQAEWETSPSHSPRWMILTGNFLWLPVLVKRLAHWEQWQARRVHDADTFAHYLGEGESLEHQLRRWHTELEQAGRPDYNVPSLIERIGHLEALRNEEHRQMRELGLIPWEPPITRGRL